MILLKIVGIIALVAFAGMCMWITLSSTFNWGNKDDDEYKY